MNSALLVAGRIPDFPQPPPEISRHPTNTTGQAVLLVMLAAGTVLVYAVALWLRRCFGTWIPLAVVAGATFSAVLEPLPDAVANLWYYAPGQKSIWTAYGNSMPVWTFLSYTVYYGGIALLFWWLVERGMTRRKLAIVCVPLAIYLGAGELVFINVLHLYTYYGPAALEWEHYPCWIPLLNTSITMSIALAAVRLRRSFAPRDALFPAFLLPSVAVVTGLLLEPMAVWTVVHSNRPRMALVWSATLLTIVIALAAIEAVLRLMPAEGFSRITPAGGAVRAPARSVERARV